MLVGCSDPYETRLYRSSDQGDTWSFVSKFCPQNNGNPGGTLIVNERRSCLWAFMCPSDFPTRCIYRAGLDGSTWESLDAMGIKYLDDACIDDEGSIFCLGGGTDGIGIYILDTADDWGFVPTPNGQAAFPKKFAVDADGCYWVAAETGLYYSPDGSSGWIRYGKEDGLASDVVNCVALEGQGAGKIVWVGTALGASRGVFTK